MRIRLILDVENGADVFEHIENAADIQ